MGHMPTVVTNLDRHGPAGLAMTPMEMSLRGGEADAAIQLFFRVAIQSCPIVLGGLP
ncbi:MAG: hypothetical protein FD187_2249 [bacterium]|nr:MAG: hypothetical protein FD142_2772 [bacterium]KAF0148036.1 MAG: hypothetical protein FD187_2249 [bacterium]KAF0167552.1 MAG: hypothetical protein FD158_2130 [bacterium]TXT16644.1 MAG: hypothetical protein FD132_2753 [bacterium]